MTRDEIITWLREERAPMLETLWRLADGVRRENVGDEVHLRGLVEISNHCVRQCAYCGLRAGNTALARYRMSGEEILACANEAAELGYGTVVMQSGEDYGLDAGWLAEVVRRVKRETQLAATLSFGERPDADLRLWREAGADRYLLRFETSNMELYERIHPALGGRKSDRFEIIRTLKRLGYETGSGVMIGIPGQTYEDLAGDIEAFRDLDLEMAGVGPYIPHPETPLGRGRFPRAAEGAEVPNSELMTYKVIALTRITCPQANIPSTTALATLNIAFGRELGLMRGANVVMPNLTPAKYRPLYEIYPAKACTRETEADSGGGIRERIASIGRTVGTGRGDSPKKAGRGESGKAQEKSVGAGL